MGSIVFSTSWQDDQPRMFKGTPFQSLIGGAMPE